MIATIAAQQVLSLRRQRTFLALLVTLLIMTSLAGVLGWLSHNTITRVYNDATSLLAADGMPAPPNPFQLKPTLSLLSNMAVYIPLIGALVALVLGHLAMADDQSDGVARLIFTRGATRMSYVVGKVLGAAAVLAAILTASLAVSVVSLAIVNQAIPTASDLGRLALFYGLSWLYLFMFAMVGMVTVLLTRRRSLALLAGLGVWLVLTYALPQFASGLRPSASLSPISDPASTSQAFFRVTSHVRPLSVTEQYRAAVAQVLRTATPEPAADTVLRVLPNIVAIAVLLALAVVLVGRHDYSRGASDE
jgi:ABC-type transport system involved in multi-copper enzyme maturation permease subunit